MNQPPPEYLVFDFLRQQNPMLTQNWKRVVAKDDGRRMLKCVRVISGVGTVCSKSILIRTEMPGVPDGFYPITDSEPRSIHKVGTWVAYPDVETARPDMSLLMREPPPPFMDNHTVGELLSFVSAYADKRARVELLPECMRVPPTLHHPVAEFNFPFGIQAMMAFDFDVMEIALREALRYSHVCFAAEPPWVASGTTDRQIPPLFIGGWVEGKGISWNNCIMLLPENDSYPINPHRPF